MTFFVCVIAFIYLLAFVLKETPGKDSSNDIVLPRWKRWFCGCTYRKGLDETWDDPHYSDLRFYRCHRCGDWWFRNRTSAESWNSIKEMTKRSL